MPAAGAALHAAGDRRSRGGGEALCAIGPLRRLALTTCGGKGKLAAPQKAGWHNQQGTDRECVVEGFGDRLAGALMRVGNPVVVGLDPRWDELPDSLKSGVDGSDSAQRATVYSRFCREIIDVIANRVAVVKPQVAFFEQLGPAGMQALAETIAHAQARTACHRGRQTERHRLDRRGLCRRLAGSGKHLAGRCIDHQPLPGGRQSDPLRQHGHVAAQGCSCWPRPRIRGAGSFRICRSTGGPCTDASPITSRAWQCRRRSKRLWRGGGRGGSDISRPTCRAARRDAARLDPGPGLRQPGRNGAGRGASLRRARAGAVINNSRGIIFAHRRREYADRFPASRWQNAVAQATDDMMASLRAETSAGS